MAEENKKCCDKTKKLGRADEKIALVTGANCGIGYETTKALNLAGTKVYLLCRNQQKTQEAIDQLIQEGCDGSRLIFQKCDLSYFASVRECAEALLEKEEVIDILLNNAGIMHYPKFELTVDGHEMTWQSNHLGHFLLTELLLPAIKRSKSGRIIIVSSAIHKATLRKIDINTVDTEAAFGNWEPYIRSKLANVGNARPGFGTSSSGRRYSQCNCEFTAPRSREDRDPKNANILIKTIFAPLRLFFKTVEQGAQTSVYLSLSPEVEGVTAKYYSDSALDKENSLALDDEACKELYDYSLKVTGLKI